MSIREKIYNYFKSAEDLHVLFVFDGVGMLQAEIDEKEVETTAGGGAVTAVINGKKEIVKLEIKPEVVDPDDVEMLQDLIIVAVNEGLRQIDEISNAEMSKLTGGLGIPGL